MTGRMATGAEPRSPATDVNPDKRGPDALAAEYRERARTEMEAAEATRLPQVRLRHEHAAAAWTALADTQVLRGRPIGLPGAPAAGRHDPDANEGLPSHA